MNLLRHTKLPFLLSLIAIGTGIVVVVDSAVAAAQESNVVVEDPKIHRGLPITSIREMPFMISLWLNNRRLCTGSIIGPRHVLSAAHCFTQGGNYSVLAGTVDAILKTTATDNADSGAGAQWRDVKQVHIFSQDVFGKDLAIAELVEAFTSSNTNAKNGTATNNNNTETAIIQPVPLSKTKAPIHSKAHIAGWGRIDDGSSPVTLQAANTTIWPNDDVLCEGILDTEICAFGEDGANTCFGDSGGPLLARNPVTNKWQQIGITSRGSFLCEFKGFFTPIRLYCDWIRKKTNGEVQCV